MENLLKKSWSNLEKITDEWFKFLGWIIVWGAMLVATIYVYFTKSKNPGFIYVKITFIIVTTISTLLLLIYIFKKSYITAKRISPTGRSKILWIIVLIQAIAFFILLAGPIFMLALTLRTLPGMYP